MTGLLHRLRLIPIVLVAAIGLFLLKVTGIVLDGGYTLGAGHQAKSDRAVSEAAVVTRPAQTADQQPARPRSWTQDMFGSPDVTGSVGAAKPAPPTETPAPDKADPKSARTPPKSPNGTVVQLDAPNVSPSERALLERLSERRKDLEKRQSEMEMRDTLLKAAEKKLEERLGELKQAEERIVAATQQKEEVELHRLKNLVTMYESMKAKDAAKIFDGLDIEACDRGCQADSAAPHVRHSRADVPGRSAAVDGGTGQYARTTIPRRRPSSRTCRRSKAVRTVLKLHG